MSSEIVSGSWKVTVPPRFAFKKELGRGGMAVVFLAYDKVGERDVALKFLPPTDDEQLKKRFQREAVDLAGVYHPNVVEFYSLGECEGVEFIEMEYVGGGALSSFLRTCDSLSQILTVFAQIAEGLHHIHENGLVHRDVKPANVLLTEDGCPKISDLGLARQQEGRTQLTQDGTVLGTAAYLAPEQLRSHAVDHLADLYAFGVCLFEAVTSRRPFLATTPLAMLRAHFEEKPPTPSEVMPGLPKALDALVLKLMEKDPKDRPASGALVAQQLREIAQGLTAEQDKLVASSPEALLAKVRQHIAADDLENARLVLEKLGDLPDERMALRVQIENARLAVLEKTEGAREQAEHCVRECRRFDDIKLLGAALVVLGRAATQERNFDVALEALQEARGLVPSNDHFLQLELLESLASLHEEGSSVGHPTLEGEKALQFRQIASSLSKRDSSHSKAPSTNVVPEKPKQHAAPGATATTATQTTPKPRSRVGLAVLLVLGCAAVFGFGLRMFLNRVGEIEIVSDPPGATVTVNEERFTAPHTTELKPGEHKVKVFLQGYFVQEETVSLAPGQKFKLQANLKPASGNLKLLSKPEGAKVFVNGQDRGKTPVSLSGLPIEKFKLKLVRQGYKNLEQEVEVFGGKTRNLEFAMTKEEPVYVPPAYVPPVYQSGAGYSSGGSYSGGNARSSANGGYSNARTSPPPPPPPRSSGRAIRVPQPQVEVRWKKPTVRPKIKVGW